MLIVLVARAAVTKYPKVKCIASQFWRLEFQDQDVSRLDSFTRL